MAAIALPIVLSVAGVVGVLGSIKLYIKCTTGVCKSKARLDGKTAIVTGANAGIGYETAKDFARRGARVIMACRDISRGSTARDKIILDTKNENVIVQKVDFASLKSVREFAKNIIENETKLDILVNNAGAGGLGNYKTEDGLQVGLQVNHFGAFLLTNLLLGKLKDSAPSRVVMVAAWGHKLANIDLEDLNMERTYTRDSKVYCNSKLCNVIVANEITRRLRDTGVTSNSLHPGIVMTDIFRNLPGWVRIPLHAIIRLFLKSAKEGAQTVIYLAVSEEVENVSGEYFVDCKRAEMSEKARDPGFAKKVWELSEEFVKLQPEERHY